MSIQTPVIIGADTATMAAYTKATRFLSNWLATRVPFADGYRKVGQKKYVGTLLREPKNLARDANSGKSLEAIPLQEPPSFFAKIEDYEAEAPIREWQVVLDKDDAGALEQLGFQRYGTENIPKRNEVIHLTERESWFNDNILTTGTFGLDVTVGGEYIDSASVDPFEKYFEPMFTNIENEFGTLEDGMELRIGMTQNVWYGLIRNPQFQKLMGDARNVVTLSSVEGVLKSVLLGNYDKTDRIDLKIRVAKATAPQNINEGLQAASTASPIITGSKLAMVVAASDNLVPMGEFKAALEENGNPVAEETVSDFRRRCCLRNYVAEDMQMEFMEDRLRGRKLYQCREASGFAFFDNTGGAFAENILTP